MAVQTVAILGAAGLVGGKLMQELGKDAQLRLVPYTLDNFEMTDPKSIQSMLKESQPDWVINSVAFLNADTCEKEPHNSHAVNFQAVKVLADAVAANGKAKLIHFSSDFVFDGKTGGYDEQSHPLPISYYGLHKYMADEAVRLSGAKAYVLRIASVIGAGEGKRDLIKALLGRVASGADKLSVIEEYKVSTATPLFISQVIAQFIAKQPEFGLYNTVAEGQTTWFDIAKTVFNELGLNIPFEPIPASAFPMPAARPPKSWLKVDKLKGVMPVPNWETIIREQTRDIRESYLSVLKKQAA